MLYAAVDDGVIIANPAERLGRHLKLAPAPATRQEEIKAMTREQLAAFLAASTAADARGEDRRLYPFFLLRARAGLRLGEAFALQWSDLDFNGREIRLARAFSQGRIDTLKSGHGRTVDMSRQLETALRHLHTPLHFSPQCCATRSSPCSCSKGRARSTSSASSSTPASSSPWTPTESGCRWATRPPWIAWTTRLREQVAAKLVPAGTAAAEVLEKAGEPSGTRTRDSLLKRQVLYRLS